MLPASLLQVQSDLSALRAAFLDFDRRGFSTVPVARGSKVAAVPWKKYQRERPSRRTLERWLQRADLGGVAVVLGAVSGGLAVRDYDQEDAYLRWAEAHPDLARS